MELQMMGEHVFLRLFILGGYMRLRKMPVFLYVLGFAVTLLFVGGVTAAGPGPVTPQEGITMVRQKTDLVIIDVRNPNEYVVEHYATARNIPVNELEARIAEVPSGKPVLVHCGIGKRAQRGYEILKAKRPDIQELYYVNGKTLFK